MTNMDGLLATLAAPRPTETELTHKVSTWQTRSGFIAECTCGQFAMESSGRDESSANAVAAAKNAHLRAVQS